MSDARPPENAAQPSSDERSLREARAAYFAANGLPGDGGYADRWVVVRAQGIPIGAFPNTDARRRAVPLHDLHHVLTGYPTTLRGEGQIAAWELASGCRGFVAAWILNGLAMGLGLVLYPRATVEAFREGWGRTNLYRGSISDVDLELSVAQLRRQLGEG